jgi:hypothetical protein
MTLRTIQTIGKKPVTAPSTVADSDMLAGIVNIKMATTLATISATMAATCAFILLEAMSTSNVTTGSAAARVDAVALLNGSYTWLHIHPASMAFRFGFQIREYRRLSLTESLHTSTNATRGVIGRWSSYGRPPIPIT